MKAAGHGTNCANCGAALTGPFCAACGQKDAESHPSLVHLAEEYVDAISHADNRIWRTLGLMAVAPGTVTREYLAGKRARFIPPVRFYFFVSLIFFLVLTVAKVALIQFVVAPGALTNGFAVTAATFAPLDQPGQGLAPEVVAEIQATATIGTTFVKGFQALVDDPKGTNALAATWVPRLLVAVMPLFAVWLWLITGRKTPLYDHVVFSLYFHAFLFLVLTLLVVAASFTTHRVPGWIWAALLGAAAVIHLLVALRRVYGLSWIRACVTFIFGVIGYVASFALCVVAVLVIVQD